MTDLFFSYKNVTVTNGADAVLKNFSFTINANEHWAFVGDAASGIPVLLQAMAGKTRVTGGEIISPKHTLLVAGTTHFKNRSNTGDFYYQQRFNSADAGDALSVWEYLAAVKPFREGAIWTLPHTLKRMNLWALAEKPIILLSNGETRRLLLAEALIKNPELLLLDNPVAGLDVASRENFNDLLEDIAASGINVVVSVKPDELPDAITHVAVFDTAALKATYTATDFAQHIYDDITDGLDENLLAPLLADWEVPVFKTLVNLEDVTIRYGEKTILDNINLCVHQGEHWAIKGHNGAGKSTLLSLVNGDNPQSYANKITLFDIKRGSGESIWDIKKHIGFVSAELPRFFPTDQSCAEIIESGLYDTMGLFRKSKPDNLRLILEWMDLFGIEAFAWSGFSTAPLSVQRLALLIRAFIKKPALLILDEPSQGLDAQQETLVKNIIDHICRTTATTLLYVSHYENEVPASVTRTLHLEAGRITTPSL
jgi:molybdate transport system ATP-binding protein